MKIAIITSTNGGVMSKLLDIDFFRNRLHHVISDRSCGAIDIANRYDIKTNIFPTKNGRIFSQNLLDNIEWDEYDLIISFYTKLFHGFFLAKVPNKLINIHPSILPACPGLNGFEDTLSSGSKFIGSTVHFIDEGMDTGKPIIQAARPYNPNLNEVQNRHLLFIDQCVILLQAIKWFDDKRVKLDDNKIKIQDAKYEVSAYAPNIDFTEAINLKDRFK